MIAGILFGCAAYAIHDADGPILCASGDKIRLAGIAARELDGSCREGQPCPLGDPMRARDILASVIGARIDRARSDYEHIRFVSPVPLTCRSVGMSYQRVVAICTAYDGTDVSCEAIRKGAAVRWARYDVAGRLLGCRPPRNLQKAWF